MDVAKTLIRTVVRAFYDTRCALVIDALFIHSVIHAEDLAYLMGMQSKDLRKVCGELKAAKLIFSHSKSEIKEGSNRTTSRDYYYIPFHHIIDAIKLRVYKVTSDIKAQYIPSSERKALHCPQCDASYTELEAMGYPSPEGYLCERCGHLLDNEDENKVADQTGYERQSRLMHQLEKFLQLLKQIDQADIPANEFDDAWAVKVEVKRPEAPVRPKFPGQPTNTVVRGAVGSTDVANLSISISTTAELTAAQEAEEAKRKAELLAKNAAPDWFKTSAVASAVRSGDNADPAPHSNGASAGVKRKLEEDEDAKKAAETAAMDDELKAYYEQMANEKRDEESGRSSDESEDEDDGFEDVNVATPPVSVRLNGVPMGTGSSNLKDDSESISSSQPATGSATPADSGMDSRPAKRLKVLERDAKPEVSDEDDDEADFEEVGKVARNVVTAKVQDEDSDEDEADFEDV